MIRRIAFALLAGAAALLPVGPVAAQSVIQQVVGQSGEYGISQAAFGMNQPRWSVLVPSSTVEPIQPT